jgi:hypothetical protein
VAPVLQVRHLRWYPVAFASDSSHIARDARCRQKVEELTNKEARNALSRLETRNPAYKGVTQSVYESDESLCHLLRADALKSTAFGPTEQVDIEALKVCLTQH